MKRIFGLLLITSLSTTLAFSQASEGSQAVSKGNDAPSSANEGSQDNSKGNSSGEDKPAPAPKRRRHHHKKKEPEVNRLEIDKKETININHNINVRKPAEMKTNYHSFCGSSLEDCEAQCNKWLNSQKKLKKGSGFCNRGENLYGETKENCMNVLCKGEYSYEMR